MASRGRPKSAEESRVLHIRFPLSTVQHLEEIASYHGGIPVSSLLKVIVSDYLKAHPREVDDFSDLLQPRAAGETHGEGS